MSRIRLFLILHVILYWACGKAQSVDSRGGVARPEPTEGTRNGAFTGRSDGSQRFLRNWNASVYGAAVHDSSIGWYSVLTPAVSYTFRARFSTDASVSLYPYRLSPNGSADRLAVNKGDVGDTLLEAHAAFYPRRMQDVVTFAMTLPSGNRDHALSVGHATVDLNNHLQRYFGKTGVLVDLGVGDSSGLFDRLVPGQDSALGPIAHAQVGLIRWSKGSSYVQSVAYEQLPIGDQKYYTTLTRPGFPSLIAPAGRKVSEDNGFNTVVGIPLAEHITLLSYYTRSLRLHLDTVSTGFTYTFRAVPRERGESEIDRALREAETPSR